MESAISLKNLTKEYPGVMALKDISFEVKKGTIHGFLGPNGAGKSTTMKIVSGLIPATSGQIFIDGVDASVNKEIIAEKIGFLPEQPPLYENMRVGDYLDFVFEINSINQNRVNKKSKVVEKCGLEEVLHRLIGNLSKGFRQRVGIAQALIYNPEIVILDEPTVGLDPSAISEIRDLILSLKEEHTVLLSTHLLHEVTLICDEISIVNNGEIIQTGTIDEIQKKFQTKQVLSAKVEGWKPELEEKLKSELPVERVDTLDDGRLSLHLCTGEDMRIPVSRFFMENQVILIEFKEEVLDLESIFKQVTGENS